MTLSRTLPDRALATSSLRLTLAAMVPLFAVHSAGAQNQAWIHQLGTDLAEEVYAAAPDGSGGLYVSGYTGGSLGGPSAGGNDAWLARYDSSGNQLWIRQLGSSGWDSSYGAAPDGAGGAYVAGVTNGNLGGPFAGVWDAWLARYDGAGNQLWIHQFGTSGYDTGYCAAPDGTGGVYIGGATQTADHFDAWVGHYDSTGKQLWIRKLGTTGNEDTRSAAPDGLGGVYVCGYTWGSLGGPYAGGGDAWLARYDSAGNQLWIRQLGTSLYDFAFAAAPDVSGGVYVGGYTGGSFGGQQAGSGDAWLARYDGAGNQLWIRQLGTGAIDDANAAAPDGSGGVHMSGSTGGSLGGPNMGGKDTWLARYDSAGNQLWIDQFGTSAAEVAYAVAPDVSGGVYLGGNTGGSLGGPNAGSLDALLARYERSCGANPSYCIAKTNSAGCVPAIATSGTPSASAGSGFTISTSSVLDNQLGLFFYSKSGPSHVSFQGGTLCEQPPLARTMLQNSGGTAPCGGMFQIDFNAYVASGKDPALVAGEQVWIQTWSHDPGFAPPNNTSLSDAVSFTLCP